MDTIEWAKKNGRPFTWRCALDNYVYTREWAQGRGWLYDRLDDPAKPGIVLTDIWNIQMGVKDSRLKCNYLIDDGRIVAPYYVVAFDSKDHRYLILHPFPTNFLGDTPMLRQDNGTLVGFSSWALGPRRTYHLKITRVSAPEPSQSPTESTHPHERLEP